MNEKEYSVSEAVRRTGVPSHVLRYWEEELQIIIHRSAQGYRIYTESDLELFRRVKLLKEKGIQLKAIRVLLEEQEDGQKYFRDQELDQKNTEDIVQEAGYEIILGEQVPDKLQQFEMILKAMIEDVVSEQNEKLEESMKACIRAELDMWYREYWEEVYRETAVSAESGKRSLWKRIFGK